MFKLTANAFLFSLMFAALSAQAQQEISFTVSNGPEFRDAGGKVLKLATAGGYNQPQFYTLDINNDQTNDLLVFDRSGNKITVLIGDGKGDYRHHPELEHIFPEFNDWVVFKDFDQDGLADIWYKNDAENGAVTLLKNITKSGDSHARFELVDIKLRAYNYGDPPLDSSDLYCDWSNIPAIEDVDGDGDIDFLTLQKFGSGITLFRNITADNNLPFSPPIFHEADVCWGDFQEGTTGNDVILKRNQWCFRKYKKHAGGSTLLLLDGDEDGDMDLILGNAGFQNLIYLQNGRLDFLTKQDTMIAYDARFPSYTVQAKVNTFPSAFYQDVTYDGIKDLIVAVNYTDKTSGFFSETGNVMFYENTGKNNKPVFAFRDSSFLVNQMIDHGANTAPVFWDMDNDGDQDMILASNGDYGATHDQHDRLVLYENVGSKTKAVFQLAVDDFLELKKDSIRRMVPVIADINRDNKPELLLGNFDGSLLLYNIVGSGKTAKAMLVSRNAFNVNVGASSVPHIADVDGDGYVDLLVGCYDGNTIHFKNTSKTDVPKFEHQTDTFGGVMANLLVNQLLYDPVRDTFYDSLVYWSFGYSAPFIKDLDGNGDPEFILGTASGRVKIYRDVRANAGKKFVELPTVNYDASTMNCYNYDVGSNTICAFADLDNDGINELVLGNSRGGIQFMQGSQKCNNVTVGTRPLVEELKLMPNPNTGKFVITGLPSGNAHIRITAMNGVEAYARIQDSSEEIDVSGIPSGIYFVHATLRDIQYSGRLVIVR